MLKDFWRWMSMGQESHRARADTEMKSYGSEVNKAGRIILIGEKEKEKPKRVRIFKKAQESIV